MTLKTKDLKRTSMNIKPLKLEGTFEIELSPIGDHRGYFLMTYSRKIFQEHGLQTEWLQENQSLSRAKHTIRGLHFQHPPHAETKLLRVIQGAMLDVFVDLRKSSPTYGKWDSIELTRDNNKMVYIPRGFAHGFCTLTENTIAQYKVDNLYCQEAEGSLRWNDPDIAIEWPATDPVLSDKDQNAPFMKDFLSPFK